MISSYLKKAFFLSPIALALINCLVIPTDETLNIPILVISLNVGPYFSYFYQLWHTVVYKDIKDINDPYLISFLPCR